MTCYPKGLELILERLDILHARAVEVIAVMSARHRADFLDDIDASEKNQVTLTRAASDIVYHDYLIQRSYFLDNEVDDEIDCGRDEERRYERRIADAAEAACHH
jgi:hypothetical protein